MTPRAGSSGATTARSTRGREPPPRPLRRAARRTPTGTAARPPRASRVAEGKTRIFASSDDRVGWRFLNERIHPFPYQEGMWTLCREVHGKLVGVVGYTDFSGTACQFHIAGDPHFISKDLLWKMFHVPFEQWGFQVLAATIAESNEESLNLASRLGFEKFATLPRAHHDGALIFMRLYRENCRWLSLPQRVYG